MSITGSGASKPVGDISDVEKRLAQDFKINSTGHLIEFRVHQAASSGSPTGAISWELRGPLPGSVLSSGSFTSSPSSDITISVSGGALMTAGNVYSIILYTGAQATNAGYYFQSSTASTYSDGTEYVSNDGGSTWNNNNIDLQLTIVTDGICSTATPLPTDTPTSTSAPTATLTPSQTPSPTPNYLIQITSTAGSPMALERTATYGDLAVFGGLLFVGGMLFIAFAYNYWRERINASIDV